MTKVHPDIWIRCGRTEKAIASKDLDFFEFEMEDGVSAARANIASYTLEALMEDPDFGHSGQRNHDAVNLCCVLHAYGVDDPYAWFEDLDAFVNFAVHDFSEMLECIKRVEPYLEKWGPEGNRSEALCFMV